MKKKKLVIIDPGHGGIDPETCRYMTGKRKRFRHEGEIFSHGGQNDSDFLEGVWNRQLAIRISNWLIWHKIEFVFTVPFENGNWHQDTGLMKRIKWANEVAKDYDCVYVSIHANAYNTKVRGWETHTHKSSKIGRWMSASLTKYAKKEGVFDIIPQRSNKHSPRLAVIKHTKMPAILVEHGFFDNLEDAKALNSIELQDKMAIACGRMLMDWSKI